MTLLLRLRDGTARRLAIDDWSAPASAAERAVCATLRGPVLDLGCGPGRMVVALGGRGVPALGVDASPLAVQHAAAAGAPALCRSIFDPLPGEGRWRGVLLFDGNIGIGGDPVALLRRTAQLLSPDGLAIVEVDPPGGPTTATTARLERGTEHTAWFPWAMVAADRIGVVAAATAMRVVSIASHERRWFATLARTHR